MENAKRKPRESFIDTIRQSLTWTRKLSIQLYLAHVARKKETKTNKCQYTFNSIQIKIREGSPVGIRVTMEERICERDEF